MGRASSLRDWLTSYAENPHCEHRAEIAEAAELLKDYEEVLADKRRLTRLLDVLWNGEKGAASQASLCDVVAQIERDLDTQVLLVTLDGNGKLSITNPGKLDLVIDKQTKFVKVPR